ATTQLFIRVRTIGLFWIKDGMGNRQILIRQMMIANDHVYTQRPGISNFFYSLYAAIQGDDEGKAVFFGIIYPGKRNTIAFIIPVRYIKSYGFIMFTKERKDNGYC